MDPSAPCVSPFLPCSALAVTRVWRSVVGILLCFGRSATFVSGLRWRWPLYFGITHGLVIGSRRRSEAQQRMFVRPCCPARVSMILAWHVVGATLQHGGGAAARVILPLRVQEPARPR